VSDIERLIAEWAAAVRDERAGSDEALEHGRRMAVAYDATRRLLALDGRWPLPAELGAYLDAERGRGQTCLKCRYAREAVHDECERLLREWREAREGLLAYGLRPGAGRAAG
jgi:hypothetical protein